MPTIGEKLTAFVKQHKIRGRGALCVALVVTRHAKQFGLPIAPESLLADSGGQVKGMGKLAVRKILDDYSIDAVIAEEAGRTNRGSIRVMRSYVAFLNDETSRGGLDLAAIEAWWIERVREHLAGRPFVLRLDPAKSLRAVVHDLFSQAQKRQREGAGMMFLGTVLQHLVGAKLSILLGEAVEHYGASEADASTGREADFLVHDVAIHVTTAPSASLLEKCKRNLDHGLRPVIVTTSDGTTSAFVHARDLAIQDRVDVFEAEQFLAGNLYELGGFEKGKRRDTTHALIGRYNEIVRDHERDPSLKIEVGD